MIIRVEKDGRVRYIDVPESDSNRAASIAFKFVYKYESDRDGVRCSGVTEAVNPETMSADLAKHIGPH